MAVSMNLVQRAAVFLTDGDSVDARICTPGSMARDIKPGGIAKLTNSIEAKGYTNVRLIIARAKAFTHCVLVEQRSDGQNEDG
jgi:hypothetical protein